MIPLKDTVRTRSFPLVNWLIIAANVGVFIFFELGLSDRQLGRLIDNYGLMPSALASGSLHGVLTLFTSMFLHAGWLHLLSNMWALVIFGDNVEDRMGSFRYLLFYLVVGTVAGLTQSFVSAGSRLPLIGASGAIAGVLAAYLVLYPGARVLTLILFFILPWFVEIPAVFYLIFWFATQFFNGVLSLHGAAAQGGVAYWAHVGGFISGLLVVWLFVRRSRSNYDWTRDGYRAP
jgi:membrane associated rhomboid family serine protease